MNVQLITEPLAFLVLTS